MKKETIIAVILGLLFGGLLGLFLITKNKEIQLNKNKVIAPSGVDSLSQVKTELNFQPLEITEPNDGAIFQDSEVVIKGKATKNSLVVVQSPIKDMVFKNDTDQLNITFPLALGENSIKIVIYPVNKEFSIQEKDLKVYYLEEEL